MRYLLAHWFYIPLREAANEGDSNPAIRKKNLMDLSTYHRRCTARVDVNVP